MNKFKGVIFDIDGTLTSTNELIFASFNHISQKYLNRTFTDKEIVAMFGPTEEVIIKKLFPGNYDDALNDYYEFYRSNHKEMANVYPGIYELVEELDSQGVLLSIYTGKGRESSIITLQETGIYKFFDLVVTGDDIEGFKPSPEGISMFLDKFELSPNDVLMIGDAPADLKASRRASVKIASVIWDSYAKDTEFWKESDWTFHSVDELRLFLLNDNYSG